MDKIVVGKTDDPNYKAVGHLADGTTVYRYDPLPPKKTLVNEKLIDEYNKSVKLADTETQQLLEKLKWDELKEVEKEELKKKISQGYVEVFKETKLNLQPEDKSQWDKVVEVTETNTSEYTSKLESLEPEEKKKPVVQEEEVPVTPVKPPKRSTTEYVEEDADTTHYTDQFKQDKPVAEEPKEIIEEVQSKPATRDKSLFESYDEAKKIEKEIESRASEDVSKSIADYYKESSEHPQTDDSEVLGYLDDPESEKTPVTEDTTEYLTTYDKSEREKLEKEKARKKRLSQKPEEKEVETPEIFKENTEKSTRSEANTTDYLELFNIEEDQDKAKADEEARIQSKVTEREEQEEKEQEDKQKVVKEKVDKLKEKKEEINETANQLKKKQRNILEKEYFRDLLEKKYADESVVENEYKKIKRDLEEKQLQRREAATQYLKQLNELTEKELATLKEYEKHIANVRDDIKSAYEPILEELEQQTTYDGVDDEFDDYHLNVNMSGKSVTVTEKDTGKALSFDYKGSLATYKIDGYRLELYSISKDPSHMVDPTSYNWFTTHFFLTYDLRSGEVIEHLSHTMTKVAEDRDIAEEDYTYEDDSWKHGRFEFTTGYGSSFCSGLSTAWEAVHDPHALSAIAPDGYAKGFVKIGVKRTGGNGAITIRYLVKPQVPSFAAATDFAIDWDTGSNPDWTGDPNQAFGSGYYNDTEEAYDSEVALVSGQPDSDWEIYRLNIGGGAGTTVNSVSTVWQTLTWEDGDYDDKYIYLRHGEIATSTNYQTDLKWYAVYLTFDKGQHYNLIADGQTNIFNHVRSTAMGPVNASATILPFYDGQDARGNDSNPFFVAVSGWSAGQPNSFNCEPLYY